MEDNSIAESFFLSHTYPVFKISREKIIVDANPAALRACGGTTSIGAPCHKTIFDLNEACEECCLDADSPKDYCSQNRAYVRLNIPSASGEYHVTSTPYSNEGNSGCYKCIYPLPDSHVGTSDAIGICRKLCEAESPSEVLKVVREFLAGPPETPMYRVRQYSLDDPQRPRSIQCVWIDQPARPAREYRHNLRGQTITWTDARDDVSFYALRENCLLLVTPFEKDWKSFREAFYPKGEIGPVMEVGPGLFDSLRLFRLRPDDRACQVFADGERHCWLDIVFGHASSLFAKLSITPLQREGRFTRQEMRGIALVRILANMQLAGIALREAALHKFNQDRVHEASQPAFQAVSSIQLLRLALERPQSDSKSIIAKSNLVNKYLLKNIETAIKVVAFLYDAPTVSRNRPSASSPGPVGFLSDVLAPMVNLLRHNELIASMGTPGGPNIGSITEDEVADISLASDGTGQRHMSLNIGGGCDIYYSAELDRIRLFIDENRLQEIIYNLLSNASKYRNRGQALRVKIVYRVDKDIPDIDRDVFKPFYVIDVEDDGIGIQASEVREIFELGRRGTAAIYSNAVGAGRGLFIAREILLSVGGDLYVERERSPTTLRMLLPARCSRRDWVSDLEGIRGKLALVWRHLGDRMLK